jgi:hypothetical protein
MTLEELKSLQNGEVVVITKVDEKINNGTTTQDYYVGEEMNFLSYGLDDWWDLCVDFKRQGKISHFTSEVCYYIERKMKLNRDNKLKELGI